MNKELMKVDPLKGHAGVAKERLVEACGILPVFAMEAYLSNPETVQEAWDVIEECYGFGKASSDHWGKVDADGMYRSSDPQEPAMAPLLSVEVAPGIVFYVYQYAIVAMKDEEGTQIMGRMD